MTRTQENIYFEARRMMNELIPYSELDYSNGIVAKAIALGKKDKLNADWIKSRLLSDVEDGFITYEKVSSIKDKFAEAVKIVASRF